MVVEADCRELLRSFFDRWSHIDIMVDQLTLCFNKILSWLQRHPNDHGRLNTVCLECISLLVDKNHKMLEKFIDGRLAEIDDKELVRLVRKHTESDLQKIRLNGMVFGIVIGLIIAVLRMYLIPTERNSLWQRGGAWIKRQFGEKTNTLNYAQMAEDIIVSGSTILEKIRREGEENPQWQSFENQLSQYIVGLSEDADCVHLLQTWMKEGVTVENVISIVMFAIDAVGMWLESGLIDMRHGYQNQEEKDIVPQSSRDINIFEWLMKITIKGIDALGKNEDVVHWEFSVFVNAILEQEYTTALNLINEVLDKISDKGLVDKVNEVAGANLQWLRISGTYVGAATGCVLFAVMQWPLIGLPIFIGIALAIQFVPQLRRRLIAVVE